MSAHQLDIISQARQANPKAISELLNRALYPKNIVTRAKLVQNRLTIFAEGNEIPDQKSLIGVIRRGVKDLEIDCLISIKIYGRKINSSTEGWTDEILLKNDPKQLVSSPSESKSDSSRINWQQLRQQFLNKSRTSLRHTQRLLTNKRFIISSFIIVLLATISTGGVIGYQVFENYNGSNKVVAEAQALIAEANVSDANSLEALTTASDKLEKARNLLRGIEDAPGSRYDIAQAELEKVRESLQAIKNQIETEESASSTWQEAQAIAKEAIDYVNKPPYPLEEWEKARDKLNSAITIMGSIPKESTYAAQATSALAEYQKKLNWMNQGIANEQKAIDVLTQGDQLARQAYDYTNGKYDFQTSELTQAKSLWQKAINHTKTVPPTSNAYRQISDRISVYTRNLNSVDDKLREIKSCWSNSYASSSVCNTVFLSLTNPDSAWE
jgi:DNA repair exonuclease SbcCD ATPase subunit